MNLSYKTDRKPIQEIMYVSHKGKGRNYDPKPQSHAKHEIIYVDYGNILLRLEKTEILLNPGDCIFIAGGSFHEFHGLHGNPFDFLNICYLGILPEILQNKPMPVGVQAREVLDKLKRESASAKSYCREIIVCLLTEFIYMMCRQFETPLVKEQFHARNNERYRSEAVRRVMLMIEQKFPQNLTLDQVSASAGISASYLRTLLQGETGHNFSYHLQHARINSAKRMLLETPFNIQEIAARVGYQSLPFFFKIFRKITGMTPAVYANSLGDPEEINIPVQAGKENIQKS